MFHIQPLLDGAWTSEMCTKCGMGKMSKWIVGKPKVKWLELFQDYVPFSGFGISGAETSGSTTNGILNITTTHKRVLHLPRVCCSQVNSYYSANVFILFILRSKT